MAQVTSPYYPPRSRWYSPLRYLWYSFRKKAPNIRILLEHFQPSIGIRATLWSLIVPGFVFRAYGYRSFGKIAMVGCGVAALIVFIWLGYPIATIAFASILSLHVSSVAFLLKRLSPSSNFGLRIISTLAVVFALSIFVYGSLRSKLEQAFMPLRIGKNVFVIRGGAVTNVKRGDWIAYRIGSDATPFQGRNNHGTIVVRDGFGLSPLLAGPGDAVRFSATSFAVNEKNFPREPSMPMAGEWRISEKQWFVWPKFAIQSGAAPDADLTNVLQSHAIISEDQFVGRPFTRWFWRKQILP